MIDFEIPPDLAELRDRVRTFVIDQATGARTYSAPQNRYYAI